MQKVNKVLITGGAGYIGNRLIMSLPEFVQVVTVDNYHIDTMFKRENNKKLAKNKNVTNIESNVSEIKDYKDLLTDVDVVVYMASLNSYKDSNKDPLFYLEQNNMNLQKFLNDIKTYSSGIKRFILTSTRGVYGEGPYKCNECKKRVYPILSEKLSCTECKSTNLSPQKIEESDSVNPISYYGLTKKIQEDLLTTFCMQNNIELDIFRIFNVYGEDQGKYYSHIGILPQIYKQITETKEILLVGNGNVTRDFIHVDDLVDILFKSIFAKNKRRGAKEIYNVGSGQSVSISDIAHYFESLGYTFSKKYHKEFGDVKFSVANNKKIMRDFGLNNFKNVYNFLSNSYKR